MLKIIIADDHPLTLQGTKHFVQELGYHIAHTSNNGILALNLITLHQPDIAILDINMPGLSGIDILETVYKKNIPTRIILLTIHKENSVYKKALEYNVFGYLLKEHADEELEKCLHAISRNEHYKSKYLNDQLVYDCNASGGFDFDRLTLTEKKITMLIADQKTTRQIAELLFISEKTVENYRSKIIDKLELPREKNALLKWAIKNFSS